LYPSGAIKVMDVDWLLLTEPLMQLEHGRAPVPLNAADRQVQMRGWVRRKKYFRNSCRLLVPAYAT
jgi:hypothetical protein